MGPGFSHSTEKMIISGGYVRVKWNTIMVTKTFCLLQI